MVDFKILFIDSPHPYLKESLTEAGFICHDAERKSLEEILTSIADYSGIVVKSRFPINRKFIDHGAILKFIARVGAGLDHVDVQYARSNGIVCITSPEGNRAALAEHSLGMILALFNKLAQADGQIKHGVWNREQNRGLEINGKTVGIIGYGNMGSAFAARLRGFGAKILAYDKYKSNFSNGYLTEVSLPEIFRETDVLSIHVPLTKETHFMVNDDFIQQFKKNFYIMNTSRGQVVNTQALVNNLEAGKVLGAALDVLEYEDISYGKLNHYQAPAFQYLCQSDKVILSPHVAGLSQETNLKHAKVLAEKVKTAFAGINHN